MRSSYKENCYGNLLSSLVEIYKPSVIHDFGVLDGYSSINFVNGMNNIDKDCKIILIDLFEDYEHKSSTESDVSHRVNFKAEENVTVDIIRGDVFSDKILSLFEDNSMEFIHIDLSNDGYKLKKFFELYSIKMKKKCNILLEGGSSERDDVNWMSKYNKQPIHEFLDNLSSYEKFTFEPFPSLTIMKKYA